MPTFIPISFLQDRYILSHILPKLVKKKHTYKFLLGANNSDVCKTFFVDTLGITNARVKSINKRRDENGFLKEDMRGRRRLHKNIIISVREKT